MRPRISPVLRPLLITVLMSGCAHLEHTLGVPLNLDAVASLDAGSHYAQVLHRFGPPTKMSALQNGMVFQYEVVHIRRSGKATGCGRADLECRRWRRNVDDPDLLRRQLHRHRAL